MLERMRQQYAATRAGDAMELEQAKLRLVMVLLIELYFVIAFLWDRTLFVNEVLTLVLMGAVFAVDAVFLGWVVLRPGLSHARRCVGVLLDIGAVTLVLPVAGEIGALLAGLFLWIPIGNGFRFGRWYMHYAQALALAGLAFVIWQSDFWRQHLTVAGAFVVALVAIPWYVSLLIARLQAARREAEAANIAKTKFLAAASHDLRQPMQALSMYSTVLEQRIADAGAARVVHGIQLSVTTLERMFDSLLDISKIESGVIRPTVIAFPLMPLIERVVDSERPIAAHKQLDLCAVPTSASVHSDPALLERMLKNLVTNAIRYTERGKIVIGCRRLGSGRLRLDVVDSGIGIAVEEQQRIFDEYYQLSGSSAQGLGLGLPIVKSLGELLGHRVSMKSAPGRGSVFSIELARAADVAAAAVAAPAPTAALSRLKVVLVDDDVEIRESMGLLLESWGCRTVAGGSVAEIERQLRAERITPDALIVDYRLADATSGPEIIERLRAAFGQHLPALIITGTTNPAHLESRFGALPFAMKPVAPGRLRAFLSQALRQA
jgi:signal transduction histidine kinase/CheY-like chemotaxis protein